LIDSECESNLGLFFLCVIDTEIGENIAGTWNHLGLIFRIVVEGAVGIEIAS